MKYLILKEQATIAGEEVGGEAAAAAVGGEGGKEKEGSERCMCDVFVLVLCHSVLLRDGSWFQYHKYPAVALLR